MKKSLFFSAVLSTLFYVNDSFAASRTYSEEYFDTKVPAAIKALGITYRDWVSKTATGTDYDFALSEDDWAHPANQYFAHSTREEQLSDLAGTPIQYGTPFLGNAGFEALFSSWTVLFGGEDIVRKSIMAHQQQISAQEERLADLQGRLTTSTAEKKRLEDQQDALGKLLSIKSENVSASLEALVSTGAIGGRKLTTLESYKAILGLSDYRDETIDTVTVRVRRESENLAGLTADIVLLEKSIGDQVKLIRGNKASLLEEEKRLRTLSALSEAKKSKAIESTKTETETKIARIVAGKSRKGKTEESAAREIAISRAFLAVYDLWKTGAVYTAAFEEAQRLLGGRK